MAEETKPGSTSGEPADTSGSVPKETYEKTLKELNNYRSKSKDLETRLSSLETEKLEKDKNFQALAEQYKLEKANAVKALEERDRRDRDQKVTGAIKQELLKLNVDPSYLEDLVKLADVKSAAYDSETGAVVGADSVAKSVYGKFKGTGLFKTTSAKNPHESSKATANGAGNVDLSKMTVKEVREYWEKRKQQ